MESSCSPSYETWCAHDAGINARKVEIRSTEDGQRGLFCRSAIFPGERFLFLPYYSLIGEQLLLMRGKEILNQKLHDGEQLSRDELTIGSIEELRELLSSNDETPCKVMAKTLGYEWRGDDGVALYLAACRSILQQQQNKIQAEASHEERDVSQEAVAQNNAIPLVDVLLAVEADETDDTLAHVTVDEDAVDAAPNERHSKPTTPHRRHQRVPSFLPHVQMLPQSFPTSPLHYSPEELARLEGTNCHAYATRILEQIEADWNKLEQLVRCYLNDTSSRRMKCQRCKKSEVDGVSTCTYFRILEHVTLEDYKWALSNIYSRSTDFVLFQQNHDGNRRRVIAPVFDMMNHSFDSRITRAMDDDGNLSVYNESDSTIPPGTEILFNYGSFPNEKFLLIYGFVLKDNPYDAVGVYAPIRPTDPLYHVKARILESRCGIDDVNAPHRLFRSQLSQDTILPPSLLSVLRLVGVQSMEQLMSIASREQFDGGIDLVSTDNEKAAMNALGHALHAMARQLALNLISDDNLHAASNLAPTRVPRASTGMRPIAEEEHKKETDKGDGLQNIRPTVNKAQAVAVATARIRSGGINVENAKCLCQSEYTILQGALSEIEERLDKLE